MRKIKRNYRPLPPRTKREIASVLIYFACLFVAVVVIVAFAAAIFASR